MNKSSYRLWLTYLCIAICLCIIGISEQAAAEEQTAAVARYDPLLLTDKATQTATPEPTAKPTVKPTTQPTPKPTPKPTSLPYSKADLDLLSRLVYAEVGSDWCSDEMQLLVANVVINRMNDSRFPDTLRGVIYQRGQYECVTSGMIKKTPNARAIANAKRVLSGERFCPAKVVWQSEFRQGKGLWKKVGNQYFCY